MPPLETSDLRDRAVLWPSLGNDRYGEVIRDTGREIDVRWEWKHVQRLDPNGTVVSTDADIAVTEDVPDGSLLFQGRLTDFLGTGSGELDQDLVEVVSSRKVRSLCGRFTRRTVQAKSYKGSLPTV